MDEVHLPQRTGPVERARVDPCHLLCELPVVSRRRQADFAQMELDVEVRVVDPVGRSEREGYGDEALAKRGSQMKAWLEDLPQPIEGQLATWGGRRVKHDQAADVPHCRRRLDVQELGVQRGELLHTVSLTYAARNRHTSGLEALWPVVGRPPRGVRLR